MNNLRKIFRQFGIALVLAFITIFATGSTINDVGDVQHPRVVVITHTPAPQLTFEPASALAPSPSPVPTSTPYKIEFGEATKFPHNLDELYKFVEEREKGYVFDGCLSDFEKPYLDWSMVKAIIPELVDDKGNHMIIVDTEKLNRVLESGGVQVEKKGVLRISENEAFGLLIQNEFKSGQYFLLCSVNNDGYPTLYGSAVKPMIEDLERFVE